MADSKPIRFLTFCGDTRDSLITITASLETWEWITEFLPTQDGVTKELSRILKAEQEPDHA